MLWQEKVEKQKTKKTKKKKKQEKNMFNNAVASVRVMPDRCDTSMVCALYSAHGGGCASSS